MTRPFRRLIVHIGQHKTGTTSLQRTLALNRRALRAAGILYPRLAGWRHAHHALIPALLGAEHSSDYVLARLGRDAAAATARSRRALARLGDSAAASGCDTLVLSSEAFFRGLPPSARGAGAALLRALADEVRLVAYIRAPADFYLSSLSTLVQSMRGIQPPHAGNRRAALESYGGDPELALSVRPFLRASLAGGSVVDDFAETHLPGGAALLARRPRRQMNETLSAEALSLLADHAGRRPAPRPGLLTRRDQVVRQAVRWLDRRIPGATRPVLHPGIADEVLRGATDMHWLRDRWDCTFPDLDYAIAGTGSRLDFSAIRRIEDLCPVDPARRDRLARGAGWLMPRG